MASTVEGRAGAPGQQPDDAYFDLMSDMARDHWWYRARRLWVAEFLRGEVPPGEPAADIGTGTGEMLAVIAGLGASPVVGTDYSWRALGHARRRDPGLSLYSSTAGVQPLPSGFAGTITCLETIEHLDDDRAALREYRRLLRPGGTLLVTVPSYEWLWGAHDDTAAHRRRYTAASLERAVADAGFEVERVTYVFSFLVVPAFLVRRTFLRRLVSSTEDELSVSHPAIERIMLALATIERRLTRHLRIPFGLSVACLAHKRR
jgi:SAM-dependent methyltransferase